MNKFFKRFHGGRMIFAFCAINSRGQISFDKIRRMCIPLFQTSPLYHAALLSVHLSGALYAHTETPKSSGFEPENYKNIGLIKRQHDAISLACRGHKKAPFLCDLHK
jgi:hypothetical protein